MSQPQEWRDAALRVHLNHMHTLLRVLVRGEYDDCSSDLLAELENCADDIKTAVGVARKAFRN